MKRLMVIIIICVFCGFSVSFLCSYQFFNQKMPARHIIKIDSPETEKRTKQSKHDINLQNRRKDYIRNLISIGYVIKTECTNSLPHIWVTEKFLLLNEIDKNKLLKPIYVYWMGEIEGFGKRNLYWESCVIKIDNGTIVGKRIGTYNPINGIKINKS